LGVGVTAVFSPDGLPPLPLSPAPARKGRGSRIACAVFDVETVLSARRKVLYAFGRAHLGLTKAPITAEIVAAIATEKAPPVDVGALRVERFA
jgi:glycine/D-amino acid oxidase-like deaminating enzyme